MELAKKISKGHWTYRGFDLVCFDYYKPDHKIAWEGTDKEGNVVRGFSMRETKFWVDQFLKDENKENPA